jgi:integrase
VNSNATSRNASNRRHSYTKVLDHRKHPVRGLWRRGGHFLVRLTVRDDLGRPSLRWVSLKAATVAEAQEELRTILVERSENRLRHVGRSPKFARFLDETYLPNLQTSGKKPGTLVTEKGHLDRWKDAIGHLDLDKIRPQHINAHLQKLRAAGRANRTCNLALVCLRNALRVARIDGLIKALPTEGIPWRRTEKRARCLFTREQIDRFCNAALITSKNGQQFADYVRLLSLCGSREKETLGTRWADVDFDRKLLTIGAEGDTKNRECRRVDMNPDLEAHLRSMWERRAPDSQWLLPSPQRGERDLRARTFRETLLLTRQASGWVCGGCERVAGAEPPPQCPACGGEEHKFQAPLLPGPLQKFSFHDCRHHFISYAVMSGVDYMTIARWVGHKDGGVLIGKVYGHLADEHTRRQAARVSFGPAVLPPATPQPSASQSA